MHSMKYTRFVAVSLLSLVGALAGVVLPQQSAHAQGVGGPLPPVPKPPNLIPLEPVEQLGKDMLYDNTLSDPSGYACAQCHSRTTGLASGLESIVNERGGPQPGIIPGRFGPRKPMSYGYAAFSPEGPFFDTQNAVFIGGNFWDGRAADTAVQAQGPPINPNEMNNTPSGTPPNQFPPLLIQKLQSRPYTPLIKRIFGPDVFTKFTPRQIFAIWGEAIAAYEGSGEICSFSSKFDASQFGTPPQNLYTLTASEERGRILYGVGPNPNNDPTFGGAQCFQCHSSAAQAGIQIETEGKDTLTMYCFANIGVPKNPGNPFYANTDPVSNPTGFNPLGTNFIDFGLGANAVGSLDGTKFFNNTPGDIAQFRGLFQTPTNRNVDQRPSPTFVKAYMHNGVFKSLQEVVHFYNKRNNAVDANGNEVAFDLRNGPPAGTTALFPPPEVIDNVQNVAGLTPAQAIAQGTTGVTAQNGQVGNLGLSASQEADLVNFLMILTDGFTAPNPVGP
jgi:cytochrome c peroxidase